jgi:hypothetical protein
MRTKRTKPIYPDEKLEDFYEYGNVTRFSSDSFLIVVDIWITQRDLTAKETIKSEMICW